MERRQHQRSKGEEGKEGSEGWGNGGKSEKEGRKEKGRVNKEQLFLSVSFQPSTERLVVSCCNRLASQSITKGDSGHSAWLKHAVNNTHIHRYSYTHPQTYARTHIRTHKHRCMHKKFVSTCPLKRKRQGYCQKAQQRVERSRKRMRTGGDRGQLPWQPGLWWQPPNQWADSQIPRVIPQRRMLISPVDHWNYFTLMAKVFSHKYWQRAAAVLNAHFCVCIMLAGNLHKWCKMNFYYRYIYKKCDVCSPKFWFNTW